MGAGGRAPSRMYRRRRGSVAPAVEWPTASGSKAFRSSMDYLALSFLWSERHKASVAGALLLLLLLLLLLMLLRRGKFSCFGGISFFGCAFGLLRFHKGCR
jgi:hypothetical protein